MSESVFTKSVVVRTPVVALVLAFAMVKIAQPQNREKG